jgi:hypothetical protein
MNSELDTRNPFKNFSHLDSSDDEPDDVINHANDVINHANDVVNHTNDVINHANDDIIKDLPEVKQVNKEDTLEPKEDTLEPKEDTLEPKEDTLEPKEDTLEPQFQEGWTIVKKKIRSPNKKNTEEKKYKTSKVLNSKTSKVTNRTNVLNSKSETIQMDPKNLVDKTLVCKDCSEDFIFPENQQHYYLINEWDDPTRCYKCRRKKKLTRSLQKSKKESVSENQES